MNKIRMGLIGCGNMMRQHLSGVDQVREVEFTAVCDAVRENAEKMSEALGGAFVTTDWREMADKVDAVLVALPHDLHYECGLFFADCVLNGKKPVTDGETSLKSLQLIWKLYEAERTGIVPDLRGFAIPEADLANYSEYVARLGREQ